jgi:serine/threonine-protein kinase RsbT
VRAVLAERRVPISSDADVVAARHEGRVLAGRLPFSRTDLTLVTTAISEVARNIIEHAGSGEIAVRVVQDGERTGVEVVAEDHGPGIPDPALALRDGWSSGGGLGLGLPGCRRLMAEFHLDTEVGRGTLVTMRKWCEA